MATLRSARTTYKNTRATTDAWFIRIERTDNKVIRLTNADQDVTMSTRVLADGSTEALSADVIYSSASGYNPTSIASQDQLNAGSIDLEGILNATTYSGSGTDTRQFTPAGGNVSASSTHGSADTASTTVNGSTSGTGWYPLSTQTNASPAYLEFDFKVPVEINRVSVWLSQQCYMSVRKSDDGKRYDEVTPLTQYAAPGAPGETQINLPYKVRSRFIRVYFGTSNATLGVTEVEFRNVISYTSSGTLTRTEIANGLYENARVYIFWTDYTDPYEDDEKVFFGMLGTSTLQDGTYIAEVREFIEVLSFTSGRVFSPACDAEYGSFRCGVHLDPPTWSNVVFAEAFTTGDMASGTWIKPTSDNDWHYYATVGGAVGASEPTWPTAEGATVIDGAVTWKATRARRLTGKTLTTVTDGANFTISAISGYANDTYTDGILVFTTGDLAGIKVRIKSQTADAIVLHTPLVNVPSAGDGVELILGCRHRFTEDCTTTHGNYINYQGFPYIPGEKRVGKFGGQG